jgi:uncharacterized OsmC-like protein
MKIVLHYKDNLHFKTSIRHFSEIDIDEPYAFHGTDLGPSSVEFILIGIGGCLGTTFIYCLQKRQIQLEDLEIIVDGRLSHIGPKRHLRLREVNVNIMFKSKEKSSLKTIEDCKREFQEHCIVTNSLREGFPINISYDNFS